jgi:hypothetical protein
MNAEEFKLSIEKDGFPKEHLLPHLIRKRGFRKVAEVGVASGNLVNRVLSDSSIDLDLYLAVDPWVVYIESYNRPPHAKEKRQDWWDSLFQRVKVMEEKFRPLWVWRQSSAEGSGNAIGMSLFLDCVYIDAIHDAENIVIDVFGWLHTISDGGVICGKPRMSYKNTYQSHWWVDVKNYNKGKYIDRMQQLYPHILKEVRIGWKSA